VTGPSAHAAGPNAIDPDTTGRPGVDTVAAEADIAAALSAAPDGAALAAAGVAVAALRATRGDPVGATAALGAAHRLRGAAAALDPDVAALIADLQAALGDEFAGHYAAARRRTRTVAQALLAG
jgi:hypothetical protein